MKKKMNLQLFAETDGSAAAGSVQSADNQLATGTQSAEVSTEGNNQVATGENAGKKMSFDELINANPDYKKDFESKMKTRIKGHKQLQGRMDKVIPLMELFAGRYGIDASDMTDEVFESIVSKALDDNFFYEDEAMKRGVDVEVYKTLQKSERENATLRRFHDNVIQSQERQQRFLALHNEAEEVKKVYPSFDLDTEMSNETFQRMAWGAGVPLKTAYEVVHHDEIMAAGMQVVAKQTAEKISNSIQAGTYRPQEGGMSQQSATLSEHKNFSKEELEDIRRRVRSGERVVL